MNSKLLQLAAVLTSLTAGLSLSAAELYVSVVGLDSNAGTLHEPLGSLAGAQARVRTSGQLGKQPIAVNIRINGQPVRNHAEFKKWITTFGGTKLEFTIIRAQQELVLAKP